MTKLSIKVGQVLKANINRVWMTPSIRSLCRSLTEQLCYGERGIDFACADTHFRHNSVVDVAVRITGKIYALSNWNRCEEKDELHG